ncbi:MAG: carbohydrate-binding domain-containing protein [Bacteroidales bacterium]|nr:carbohydrate-binding domain-containing protein [Bacteroidales bacterium]
MKYTFFRHLSVPAMAICAMSLCLSACSDDDDPVVEEEDDVESLLTTELADSIWSAYSSLYTFTDATEVTPTDTAADYYEDYADNWLEGDDTRDVTITFSDDTATVEFASSKNTKFISIDQDGAHLVIYNDSVLDGEAAGRGRMNFILKGSTSDGSVRFYSNKKFMITLDGVSLTNSRGAAINVQKSLEKKRVFVNIAEGTENYLTDATNYTDTVAGEDDKGCLFSEGKLVLMGDGQLTVTGNYNHAIAADDRMHIHSGVRLNVVCNAKDGIHINDELVMSGGLVQVYAPKDAVQCDSLSDGLVLRGGRLLTCAKRAITATPFVYSAGSFCAIGASSDVPTSGLATWSYTKQEDGYYILESAE